MNVVKFPSTLPTAQQLELPCLHLVGLLQSLTADLAAQTEELMRCAAGQGYAVEVAAIVHKTAGKIAEASAGWAAMSDAIRSSWGVRR